MLIINGLKNEKIVTFLDHFGSLLDHAILKY